MTQQTETRTTTWTLDKSHSNVDFSVKHLMISTVRGHFRDFDATIELDEANPESSTVSATVKTASIDTGEEQRDTHLRSDDFFNAEKYPEMKFRSTRIERLDETRFRLTGDLTIRDVTREAVLHGKYEGRIKDPWGNDRIAFTAEGSISRNDFGVRWNQALETGGVVVGDKVKLTLRIEAVRRP